MKLERLMKKKLKKKLIWTNFLSIMRYIHEKKFEKIQKSQETQSIDVSSNENEQNRIAQL